MNMKMTLAAMGLIAASSQAQGSLWSMTATDYQVQVPCVINNTPSGDVNDDLITDTYDCAGWWYGYGFGAAGALPAGIGTWSPKNAADGSLITTDKSDGSVILNGNLTATGIKITLNSPAGAQSAPTGAGIGFDYMNPKGAVDITNKPGTTTATGGYCLTYISSAPLNLQLGWAKANGDDNWFTTIPAAPTGKMVDLPWTGANTAATAGVWKKDAWADGVTNLALPITAAQTGAFALQFVLKNGTVTALTADLEIQQLGWVGECGPAVIGPVATIGSAAKSSLNANLSGRSLAFSGFGKKSVTAEVISIQGQVVARQVVSAASATVDLSKVAAGVYVVKASGKGLSMNKMIAIK